MRRKARGSTCELNSEWAKKETLTRFGTHSLATLEYVLRWRDGNAEFEDRYLARRVNAWRDIMPPGMGRALEGLGEGESAALAYGPGRLTPDRDASLIKELPRSSFEERAISGRTVLPRRGRFYPQGMAWLGLNAYKSSLAPMRILELDSERMVVDLNHPLAGRELQLEARILRLEDKRSDTGGTLHHWPEAVCDLGPGMQAALPGSPTDFLDPDFFSRKDESRDGLFYDRPRLVDHVDSQASRNIEMFYARHLAPGMAVLDLMAGCRSHLPSGLRLQVTGLGLNAEEMRQNPALDRAVAHDLNAEPVLPADLGTFDAVTLSLSIEYLTEPVAVLRSVRSRLRPGATLMVGTSNRWFPTKTVAGWLDLNEFERMGLILELMRRAGFHGPCGAVSMRNDWRPQDDRHFLETRGVSDPVYVVWAKA